MLKTLILAAMKDELLPVDFGEYNVEYTGIGKINAAYTTTKMIHQDRPDLIINIGTAGTLKIEHLGKVHRIKNVIEHDVRCEPLSSRGKIPFDSFPNKIEIGEQGLQLATGDSFIIDPDQWLFENKIDLVDMECFAIAKVALKERIPFLALKFASDLADSNAHKDWKKYMRNNPININYEITNLLKEINV